MHLLKLKILLPRKYSYYKMELIEIFLNIIHGYRNVSVDRKKKRPVGRTPASKWDKHLKFQSRGPWGWAECGHKQGVFKPSRYRSKLGFSRLTWPFLGKRGRFCWMGRMSNFWLAPKDLCYLLVLMPVCHYQSSRTQWTQEPSSDKKNIAKVMRCGLRGCLLNTVN